MINNSNTAKSNKQINPKNKSKYFTTILLLYFTNRLFSDSLIYIIKSYKILLVISENSRFVSKLFRNGFD